MILRFSRTRDPCYSILVRLKEAGALFDNHAKPRSYQLYRIIRLSSSKPPNGDSAGGGSKVAQQQCTTKVEPVGSAIAKYYNATNNKFKQQQPQQQQDKNISRLSTSELGKVRASQKYEKQQINRRRMYDKLSLTSYLNVCVDVGQINRAFNTLIRLSSPKKNSLVDIDHYNIILKGWAQLGSVAQIVETRMHMIRCNIEPNTESFAYILLAYTRNQDNRRNNIKRIVEDMKSRGIDSAFLFHSAYLGPQHRKAIINLLRTHDANYEEIFCDVPIDYNCKLMKSYDRATPVPYEFSGLDDLSKMDTWADHQRMTEHKSSLIIKSVAQIKEPASQLEHYSKLWQKLHDMWGKSLSTALDQSLEILLNQSAEHDKIHLYPYLCAVDKTMLTNLMLDEIEVNASCSSYSVATSHLHLNFGNKVMTRYLKFKAISDGSHQEKQKIYHEYLREYLTNPSLMSQVNSRQFLQIKAKETKNYSIYKDRMSHVEEWPHHIVAAVGRFLYGLMLREIKFDPTVLKGSNRDTNPKNMVHAFYTAYFQIDCSHKIKEEFRAHQDFERLYGKASASKLRFDYSFLPCSSPPMPWLSRRLGGYLTNKTDLVRVANPFAEHSHTTAQITNNQKLYPSLDSLNAIGLCPWIVNKEILDLVIGLFRAGGDTELNIPLEEHKMEADVPVLKDNASKADRILYNREKKRHDQKRREMYSLWRDCLYRLSIANHFRDRIFWFPHNMDFRGRTYPVPPHFNHLGADLARSLLLFAKGRPLGEGGLDWLKLHLINLVGSMKSASLSERLDYANSILHLEVLDSADNPWDGRKWWTQNENPWQVLACCKEIAKAIRSKDFKQYVSHFPVHQDGSCNGLQHYAALGRDPGGAMAVNLIPNSKPQDVYSRVVDIVEAMRRKDAAGGLKIAVMLEGFIQRKVIKQTVMTTVYGVTRYGARHQIARQLTAKGYNEREIWQAAQYLATKTFESIGQMFNKSRLIQDWLNDCAFVIASRCRQPVSWETPLGFPITQPYTLPIVSSANRLLASNIDTGGQINNDPYARLNASKQKTAFPPNYIHSLDSSHMMLTSLHCQRQGLTYVSVHDCYWTHPSTVDMMNKICREQFIALHSEPLLEDLSQQFVVKYGGLLDEQQESLSTKSMAKMLEKAQTIKDTKKRATFMEVPTKGDLDLNKVLESTYFFS